MELELQLQVLLDLQDNQLQAELEMPLQVDLEQPLHVELDQTVWIGPDRTDQNERINTSSPKGDSVGKCVAYIVLPPPRK